MSYAEANLDLLRQNLQRSINHDIKSIITKYIDYNKELPRNSSPSSALQLRRRKKRSSQMNNTAPGSSLSGLNRNSIRVVELFRSKTGYGFTISGQKPCLLRCIVEDSPAEKAGLVPGNCLVGVNGKDVSHLAHDDVVRLIGNCTGLLRLHVADYYYSESSDEEVFQANGSGSDRFKTQSSSGSSSRTHLSGLSSPSERSEPSLLRKEIIAAAEPMTTTMYQAVICYIGSVDLPEIEERRRLKVLSSCVRRLRLEKRVRSIVLLRIQSNGISLYSSSQNVQNGPPLAFYSSSIISFCGAYSDDRRYFGLVTCVGPSKNCSCHVFMVESKFLRHSEHLKRARALGIQCTSFSVPKNGQVLGIQECSEFPATADPILSSILSIYQNTGEEQLLLTQSQRSPSEASNRLESTNSSNSDSGIGFRDESDRTSARIYDIIGPDLPLELRQIRRSPVPRKRFPMHKKSPSQPQKDGGSHNAPRAPQIPGSSRQMLHQRSTSPMPGHSRDIDMAIGAASRVGACFYSNELKFGPDDDFEPDESSLKEILKIDDRSSISDYGFMEDRPIVAARKKSTMAFVGEEKLSQNLKSHLKIHKSESNTSSKIPEVLVTVTPPPPPRAREKRASMEYMTRITSPDSPNERCLLGDPSGSSSSRVSLARNGTRSLENLCSSEILTQGTFESKTNIGSSTPVLASAANISSNNNNQDLTKPQSDFAEFKIPEPPAKPKMEINVVEKWAESIEKLMADPCGQQVFTIFLQREFSAENIYFYTDCLHYKEVFPDLTQSQRISTASTIFQRYLQNGATDPVNVDFQARSQVEKALSNPCLEMFDLAIAQVFNLLKFDCYPRFLRSELFRDYPVGTSSQHGDPSSSSDQESVKSHKVHSDGRRRSLLPWNIKNRYKNKQRSNKSDMDGLNSDISFIQRTADIEGSDQEGFRRESYRLCRVILPDNSTTVLRNKPGETLFTVVQRILEKREFHYSAFEVISVATGKPIDLNMEVSEMNAREIKVEPRAFLGIELPMGWRVGVRSRLERKIAEVLKPILAQHHLKLESIVIYDLETDEVVDVKWLMGRVDGHNIIIYSKNKDANLDEIAINQDYEYDQDYLDDDQCSIKTSSSQSSSVFKGFLRRSSKKYKRNKNKTNGNFDDKQQQESNSSEIVTAIVHAPSFNTGFDNDIFFRPSADLNGNIHGNDENKISKNLQIDEEAHFSGKITSPLSLLPNELNLIDNSRNRKPIYLSQLEKKEATLIEN